MDEEKKTDFIDRLTSQWYVDVLYYLDKILDSEIRVSDQSDDIIRIPSLNERILELFKFCTQKMYMDNYPDHFYTWNESQISPQRWPERFRDMNLSLEFKLNEVIRFYLERATFGDGAEYLNHYFNYCIIQERSYFGEQDSDNWQFNTLLLDCITPEFYKILFDHVVYILEYFQIELTERFGRVRSCLSRECSICYYDLTENPPHLPYSKIVSTCKFPCGHCFHTSCITDWFRRSQICPMCKKAYAITDCVYPDIIEKQYVGILLALMTDFFVAGLDPFSTYATAYNDWAAENDYADIQKRQYQQDFMMLNHPDEYVRETNRKKIRDRYNAKPL